MKKGLLKIVLALLLLSSYTQAQTPTDTLTPGDTLQVVGIDTLHVVEGDTLIVKGDSLTRVDTLQVHEEETLKDHCILCSGKVHTIIYAPYYTQFNKQWPFLLSSAAVYASGFILTSANKHAPLTEAEINNFDKNSVNKYDRPATENYSPSASKASDYVLLSITVLPIVFLSEHHTRVDILPLAIMAAEAYLFNYGVTTIAKNLSKRARPYVYNPDVPLETQTGPGAQESFFSGHTSQTAAATFLFANVITDYHPTMRPGIKTGLWIFAATVPAVEGYLRVQAGKHFPTDVITGYVVGAASGWAITRLHRYQKTRSKTNLGFLPYKDGMMMSLTRKI
ncbi:MAG: phosphatase PAP2 family protein [Bacteroidia bacterium]